jgi:hypothetical protein
MEAYVRVHVVAAYGTLASQRPLLQTEPLANQDFDVLWAYLVVRSTS